MTIIRSFAKLNDYIKKTSQTSEEKQSEAISKTTEVCNESILGQKQQFCYQSILDFDESPIDCSEIGERRMKNATKTAGLPSDTPFSRKFLQTNQSKFASRH